MRRALPLLAALAAALCPIAAQGGQGAPPIRISGSPADGPLIAALERGFRAQVRDAVFTESLHGAESTLAGVYTGTADIALMAREVREPMERMAYEWATLHPPLIIEIATAGITRDRPSDQIGIFVHADNPVARLSLADLDAVFGAEHKRAPANARRWSDLGGATAHPLHVYGPDVESVDALFLRRRVMDDSRKWNEGYRTLSSTRAALAAVAADPDGIAFAPVAEMRAGVKLVALADADDRATLPDREAIAHRRYPLTRTVDIVVAHDKGAPVAPRTRAFIAYLLSPAGQAAIAADGTYLPLEADEAARQLAKLEAAA